MTDTPYLIASGCCRGGTTYLTRVLQCCGYAVQHEDWGADGNVSCHLPMMPTLHESIARHRQGRPLVLLHQLRHPLHVVNSNRPLVTTGYHSHILAALRRYHAQQQPAWRLGELSHAGLCGAYWVAQYDAVAAMIRAIQAQQDDICAVSTFRVEDVPGVIAEWSWMPLCQREKGAVAVQKLPTTLNTGYQQDGPRGYTQGVTWSDVEHSLPGSMRTAWRHLAQQYGYRRPGRRTPL